MASRNNRPTLPEDPLWYKDGVIYQTHVRAFFDSDADGIGDFRGLTEKLDYLEDLGVTAIWLLPFYPSPLKDDGYDIASYTEIHPNYGTMNDFKVFMKEAKRRNLRVITELVINHTSDQHPWFQRSRSAAPGSRWRDFYVWTDNPAKYKAARIIFKDFETSNWTWDPVAKAYFWHRFYHHQPDLNFENQEVHRAVLQVLDYWMKMGVDGLRLDAVPYLYEQEGTSCENLPQTHQFLKKLRKHVDDHWGSRMLLAEANQWPEDSRPYFGDGDECHVAFHFPLMPRLFMSVAMEDRYPIIDIMQQTPPIPESCQWALFLRNHDELTLEMVTDEDRDYMYRTYAADRQARINLGIRRRLAPLMENHRDRIELMNALLFSFPGTPIIYYGDEIGMGDNIYLGDRNGVRTPMQWSSDRNAGFSRANPQKLFLPVIIDPAHHYEAVNVEAQQNNTYSLLWWMKRLISLRKEHIAFGRGTLEFLHPENRKVLALIREYGDEAILVIANLSRFVQPVELDLSRFKGRVPVEMFGQTRFPQIGDGRFFATLSPYGFYWLSLAKATREEIDLRSAGLPRIHGLSWTELLEGRSKDAVEDAVATYIRTRRWFGAKALDLTSSEIIETIGIPGDQRLVLIRMSFLQGDSQMYVLPLGIAHGDEADEVMKRGGDHLIATLGEERHHAILYEASGSKSFGRTLVQLLRSRKDYAGGRGELRSVRVRATKQELSALDPTVEPALSRAEASNTALLYGDKLFVKMFRKVESGINPDLEISKFLAEETEFRGTPRLVGALEYVPEGGEPIVLALANAAVPNATDAWSYSLDELARYFDRIFRRQEMQADIHAPTAPLLDLSTQAVPPAVETMIATYVRSAELLGKRTAEMHLALASGTRAEFRAEPFSPHYQRSIYETMRTHAARAIAVLKRKVKDLPAENRELGEQVIAAESQIQQRFRHVLSSTIDAMRIRVHGDYHLGQVLYTGKDFYIIDFEGEPSRPLSERRLKRSALRDVAGMIRSFHYVSHAALLGTVPGVTLRSADMAALGPAAEFWQRWVSAIFLREYLKHASSGNYLPRSREDLRILLDAYTLEKAMYEVGYELNNRPNWVGIPLRGILDILKVS